VSADHRKMCQFGSQDDKTYKAFVTNVRLILQGEEEHIENEHFIVSQIENPNFTGRSDIRQLLHKSLLKDRRMRKQNQDRFVLYGMGGSGKTQICVRFAHDHRNWCVPRSLIVLLKCIPTKSCWVAILIIS